MHLIIFLCIFSSLFFQCFFNGFFLLLLLLSMLCPLRSTFDDCKRSAECRGHTNDTIDQPKNIFTTTNDNIKCVTFIWCTSLFRTFSISSSEPKKKKKRKIKWIRFSIGFLNFTDKMQFLIYFIFFSLPLRVARIDFHMYSAHFLQ